MFFFCCKSKCFDSLLFSSQLKGSWWTCDLLAISLTVSAICFLQLPNVKVSFLLLWIFTFYDLFWVFLSSYIFGKGVMETVAVSLSDSEESLPIPILYRVPHVFSDGEQLMGKYLLLHFVKRIGNAESLLCVQVWGMWCCRGFTWLSCSASTSPSTATDLRRRLRC